MEKAAPEFAVVPAALTLNLLQDAFTLAIKNTSYRSCHYEIFLPDCHHFKIVGNRTFSLAPGITKMVKIRHFEGQSC